MLLTFAGSTMAIAHYLYELVAPIYDASVTQSTAFRRGTDAVRALESYDAQGCLRSKTFFATIHIKHLCTMFAHDHAIELFERFLVQHAHERREQQQHVSTHTLVELARLVLTQQYFMFNGTLVRQKQGGPPNWPFMVLMGNIYAFYWQETLVAHLQARHELFGR
jgi:hypothetical protein